jgi:hypothetical protein
MQSDNSRLQDSYNSSNLNQTATATVDQQPNQNLYFHAWHLNHNPDRSYKMLSHRYYLKMKYVTRVHGNSFPTIFI